MPFFYDHVNTLEKHHPSGIVFSFNDEETDGETWHWHYGDSTEYCCKYVEGSKGVSTVVTLHGRECLVEDYFISVVCEDVEAFVRNQKKEMYYIKLEAWKPYRDQKLLEQIINRVCGCLENSLQSRTEKLKVQNLSLPVLKISQAVSAVNLLDREILKTVSVHLPFEDQVFRAEDFIPLIEGQGRQRLYLTIQLYKFSPQVLEEVRKIQNLQTRKYQRPNSEILRVVHVHLPFETQSFTADDFIPLIEGQGRQRLDLRIELHDFSLKVLKEVRKPTLSDNKCHLNIFEVPLILKSIASHLEFFQIQSLRKVSRGVRQCVDYVILDPHIHSYHIFLGEFPSVIIKNMMCAPTVGRYTGSVEQEAIRVVNDFDLNTRHQKSRMDGLIIEMDEKIWKLKEDPALSTFFKGMRDVLISRTSPLKVRNLTFVFHWQCLMIEILPYLDAEFLNSITIQKDDKEYTIEIVEILKTEQWSKAKLLWITNLTVRMSIQDMNILNFETIDITVETMSLEDITYCRKNLTQPSVFEKFKIHIKNCATEDFLASLGEPYRVVNNFKYIWFFRIENTPEYLHIVLEQVSLQTEGCLHFAKVHQDKTSFNVRNNFLL